jgi:hypothetical protein
MSHARAWNRSALALLGEVVMRTRQALALASCAVSMLVAAPARSILANYEDWWWSPDQSGHGLNVGQQADVLFVSWFTYDEAGAGMWLTLSGTLDGVNGNAITIVDDFHASGTKVCTMNDGNECVYNQSTVTSPAALE